MESVKRTIMNKVITSVAWISKGVTASMICIFAGVLLFAVFGLAFYVYPKHKDGVALENCKTEEDVVSYFKREPEEVYLHLDQMTFRGWKLPTRPITNKILVYTRTATKFYIYIGRDGSVEYVYRSSS